VRATLYSMYTLVRFPNSIVIHRRKHKSSSRPIVMRNRILQLGFSLSSLLIVNGIVTRWSLVQNRANATAEAKTEAKCREADAETVIFGLETSIKTVHNIVAKNGHILRNVVNIILRLYVTGWSCADYTDSCRGTQRCQFGFLQTFQQFAGLRRLIST